MSKRGLLKIGGFIGTLAGGAALVATAAGGTGAWFTDSANGNITAQAGHLTLSTGDTTMDWRGIMPGEDRSQTVGYDVDVSGGKVDVWVKFDTGTVAYSKFTGFNGPAGSGTGQNGYDDGGLGRYGHFAVTSSKYSGPRFNSYNLQNAPDGTSGCANNNNGWGSSAHATGENDTSMGYCGVPGLIKVASGLSDGAHGTVTLTFGLTGKQTQQNQLQVDHLPYQIVATQAGHRPGDPNF